MNLPPEFPEDEDPEARRGLLWAILICLLIYGAIFAGFLLR